jgi:hypothetical protein
MFSTSDDDKQHHPGWHCPVLKTHPMCRAAMKGSLRPGERRVARYAGDLRRVAVASRWSGGEVAAAVSV